MIPQASHLAKGQPSLPPQPHDAAALAQEQVELQNRPSLLQPASFWSFSNIVLGVGLAATLSALVVSAVAVFTTAEYAVNAVATLLAVALILEIVTRISLRPLRLRSRAEKRDALLLLMVTVAALFVCRLTGSTSSPLLPVPLALVAFAGAVLAPRLAVGVATITALLMASLYLDAGAPRLWFQALGMASSVFGFVALSSLILRSVALRFRDRAAVDSELRLQRLLDDARAYRLTGARHELGAEHKRNIAAAMAVRESISQVVEVASRALRPHTTVLFLLDENGATLRVRELRSASDHIVSRPISAKRGVLGSVVSKRAPVNLHHLKPDFAGITYYEPAVHPQSFLGVPVFEGEHLRGVLAVDSVEAEPFTPADEALLQAMGREVVRAVEVERLFAVMDLDRRSQQGLLRLVEALNSSLTLDAVLDALVDGILAIADCELAAVVVAEEEGLVVARVRGREDFSQLQGVRLDDAGSLVASVIRTQAALPARGDLTGSRGKSQLFGATLDPPGLRRGRVLPLGHQKDALGAVVAAARNAEALGDEVVQLLHVAAGYGAIALINGRLYAEMERMATRDGLTGLLNHRTFQENLEQALARSRRQNQPLTLLLCDIDHFKQVNDTYGHPCGDEVLRRVSSVLTQEARCTDLVARYGGEEFAIIMEATDPTGAFQVAERIRNAIAAQVVMTEKGSLKVTLSAGLATFPSDASDRADLIKRTDGALYQAKNSGRNRSLHVQGAMGVR